MIIQGVKLRCKNEPEPSFMMEKREGFIKGRNKFVTLSTLELHKRNMLNDTPKTSKRKKNKDDDRKEEGKDPKKRKLQE